MQSGEGIIDLDTPFNNQSDFSSGIPIPVSETANSTWLYPEGLRAIRKGPLKVNLKAFYTKISSTCLTRRKSVRIKSGEVGDIIDNREPVAGSLLNDLGLKALFPWGYPP